jgi:hypothetical protein
MIADPGRIDPGAGDARDRDRVTTWIAIDLDPF